MPAKFVKIESIPHDEVAALQAAELEIDFHRAIRPPDEDCSVHSAWIVAVEELDEPFEGIASVMHVLHHKKALSCEVLRTDLSLDPQLSGGVQTSVGFYLDEIVAMLVLQLLYKVGVKHEGTL